MSDHEGLTKVIYSISGLDTLRLTQYDGNRRLIYVSVAGVSVLLSDMEDVVNEFKRRAEITPQ